MIGLDTNVVVRYLVEDDKDQAARAAGLIEGAADRGDKLFVGQVVLCELAWVLDRAYGRSRSETAAAIRAILRTAQFIVEDADVVYEALARFESGRADFADFVITSHAFGAGCETFATFDKKLLTEADCVEP